MSAQHRPRTIHTGRIAALSMALVAGLVGFTATTAPATGTTTTTTPIVVGSPTEVPAGAVEDVPSQYQTANPCDTTRSWVHTTPAVDEVSHQEWTAETRTRTYTPAVQGVKEYKYSKTIPGTKTETRKATKVYTPGKDAVAPAKEYEFDKKVERQKARWDGDRFTGDVSRDYTGSYTWRDAGFASVWSSTNTAPTAPGPVKDGFIHNSNGSWYYTLFYKYFATGNTRDKAGTGTPATVGSWGAWVPQLDTSNGWTGAAPATPAPKLGAGTYPSLTWTQTRTVADPSADTVVLYNGGNWTTDVPGAPWVRIAERWKVQPQDATYGAWTAWTPYGTNPYLSDPQLPANTHVVEYRKSGPVKVVDSAYVPPVVTHYAWSDNKVCETPTPTPTPTPTVTVTATPTPTPTPDTEVLPEQASGKAVGSLKVSCQGTVRVTMKNRSDERATYTVKVAKRSHKVKVPSGKTRTWVTSAAPRDRAQLWLEGKLLASKRLPKPCNAPEVLPETGLRG